MPQRYNRLRVILAEREMSIGSLADTLQVHRNTASAWVTNKAQPSIPTLYRIAEALGVDVCALLVRDRAGEGEA